mmetsp:Transcript_1745/g.3711  ORF Transcript_1745/g.3711 Transcript_1745/m.3711 type:complete len:93 (+) Transcript_1745:51-329(+)
MPILLLFLASIAAGKDYFMCNDDKHACVVGTTCCGFTPYAGRVTPTAVARWKLLSAAMTRLATAVLKATLSVTTITTFARTTSPTVSLRLLV